MPTSIEHLITDHKVDVYTNGMRWRQRYCLRMTCNNTVKKSLILLRSVDRPSSQSLCPPTAGQKHLMTDSPIFFLTNLGKLPYNYISLICVKLFRLGWQQLPTHVKNLPSYNFPKTLKEYLLAEQLTY